MVERFNYRQDCSVRLLTLLRISFRPRLICLFDVCRGGKDGASNNKKRKAEDEIELSSL